MRTFAVFCAKNFDSSKFIVFPHEQEGLSQCVHVTDKGGAEGGQFFFLRFCADVFCGRSFI